MSQLKTKLHQILEGFDARIRVDLVGSGSLRQGELCALTCTEMGSFWTGGR